MKNKMALEQEEAVWNTASSVSLVSMNAEKNNICLLRGPFSKAYDNVKHELLWKKLQGMKFPDKMLQMLKCIYRENISCVKVNKSFTKLFKVSTGLWQGCLNQALH